MLFQCTHALLKIKDLILCEDVTITINDGEFYRICGANGIGKTVLTQAILGLNESLSSVDKYFNDINKTVYIPDTPFFLDQDSVQSVLNTLKRFYGIRINDSIQIATQLGLSIQNLLDSKISTLSLGMQKKLMLIPLFTNNNPIFVLDEIFTGLDIEAQNCIIDRLVTLHSLKQTIILIEHNQSIINALNLKINIKEIQCNKKEIKS